MICSRFCYTILLFTLTNKQICRHSRQCRVLSKMAPLSSSSIVRITFYKTKLNNYTNRISPRFPPFQNSSGFDILFATFTLLTSEYYHFPSLPGLCNVTFWLANINSLILFALMVWPSESHFRLFLSTQDANTTTLTFHRFFFFTITGKLTVSRDPSLRGLA